MKLIFDEIVERSERYTIDDGRWLPPDEPGLSAVATVSLRRHSRDTVLLEGQITGKRGVPCDRCGQEVVTDLRSSFFYRLTTKPAETPAAVEKECRDEDVVTVYLDQPVIDVEAILREQAYLAIPLKTLCREDCKGICAGCGVVLNDGTCHCMPDWSKSPFSVLKKIYTGNEH